VLVGALAFPVAGLGAAGLAGCTSERAPDPPPGPPRDVVLADAAALRERRLLAAYDLALARAPELAERLLPLRAHHVEHLAALGVPDGAQPDGAEPDGAQPDGAEPGVAGDQGAVPGAEPASPSPTPTAVLPPPLPEDPAGLLAALADLERRASAAHAAACLRSGRGLAVVLASAAAGEAAHPVALQ
jgi:hypothetical protein